VKEKADEAGQTPEVNPAQKIRIVFFALRNFPAKRFRRILDFRFIEIERVEAVLVHV